MSLLNQVLQDLEKRNAENTPEYQQLNNVKATPINQERSYYLPFAILCIIGIVAIIIFNAQKTPGILEKQNIVKQSVIIQSGVETFQRCFPQNPGKFCMLINNCNRY